MRRSLLVLATSLLASGAGSTTSRPAVASPPGPATQVSPLRFQLSLAPEAARAVSRMGLAVPVTGRAFVLITREGNAEPRLQVDARGAAFFARDVRALAAGGTVVIASGDAGVLGYPFPAVSALPPGDYLVQGFLSVYTTFHRADGRVLEMHADQGEGQHPFTSPGNVHSRPVRLHVDPRRGGTIRLSLSEVIPPLEPVPAGGVMQQGNPPDGGLLRHVKIRSELLSRFWGRDIYLGANLLLPRGYDDPPVGSKPLRYPMLLEAGHFPGGSVPLGMGSSGLRSLLSGLNPWWMSDEAPMVIGVAIRDANPYYDTSYWIDSPNVGPYGRAITEELIPYLEKHFRLIAEPWARVVAGGSTGGWEALAFQVFHPEMFAGTWGWCPDPVDFHYHQIVDIYRDANAYTRPSGWLQVERPASRLPNGNIETTMRQENDYERALGPNDRSAEQWAIWEAAYGPVGPDGYPARIWDPVTGAVNHDVARWWQEHTDLNAWLGRNWSRVGPALRGKIHVTVGDADTYYLNDAVHLLQDSLARRTDPAAMASFEYGRDRPHCWMGESTNHPGQPIGWPEAVTMLARYVASHAPAGADRRWMR